MYPPEFKKLFREMIPKYREDLGVGAYSVDVRYDSHKSPNNARASMSIHVDTDYLRATLTVYPLALDDWKMIGSEEFREDIAHEMAHLATQPLRDLVNRTYKTQEEVRIAWESLTTILGRYLYTNVKKRRPKK